MSSAHYLRMWHRFAILFSTIINLLSLFFLWELSPTRSDKKDENMMTSWWWTQVISEREREKMFIRDLWGFRFWEFQDERSCVFFTLWDLGIYLSIIINNKVDYSSSTMRHVSREHLKKRHVAALCREYWIAAYYVLNLLGYLCYLLSGLFLWKFKDGSSLFRFSGCYPSFSSPLSLFVSSKLRPPPL